MLAHKKLYKTQIQASKKAIKLFGLFSINSSKSSWNSIYMLLMCFKHSCFLNYSLYGFHLICSFCKFTGHNFFSYSLWTNSFLSLVHWSVRKGIETSNRVWKVTFLGSLSYTYPWLLARWTLSLRLQWLIDSFIIFISYAETIMQRLFHSSWEKSAK